MFSWPFDWFFYYTKLFNTKKFQGFYFRVQIINLLIFRIIYNLTTNVWNKSGLRLCRTWVGRQWCETVTWNRCRFVTRWSDCIIIGEDFILLNYYAFYAELIQSVFCKFWSQLWAVVLLMCANKRSTEGFFWLIFLI